MNCSIKKFWPLLIKEKEIFCIDLALETVFHSETGTIAFLNRSIKERKIFLDSNIIIFNTWITVLKEYGPRTNFEPYIDDIIQCCMRYVISTQVSAKEKEKAVIVLQEIFINKLVEDIDASELVIKLLDVFNLKNRPGTFTQQVLILLGIISRDSPENVSGSSVELVRNVMLKSLEDTLLNEETIQYNILSGAMEGLNYFLTNFAPSPTDEPQICDSIYICVKKLSSPTNYVKQKAPFRASLDVFTHHYHLFANQIYRDFKFWHECLTTWLTSTAYDDRRKGIYGMQTFHKAIEKFIEEKDIIDINILKFLMSYYRSILESSKSKPYENRIAIRGFGLMAKACQKHLPEVFNDMLSLVIQRTDLISLAEDNELRDSLEHFPDYVEALSQILKKIGHDNENIAQILAHSIQNILIRLIRDFHYLSKAHTALASNSICCAFYNLSELNGSLFDSILENVILQGVIWTCSHKLVYDANLDWETDIDWKENITYKFYLDLWQSFLEESQHSNFDKPMIAKHIFNSLMSSLFTILEKLDLRTKRRVFTGEDGQDQEFYFCDPSIDLCPERPKDFHIFFNLVDFYREIFFSKYRRDNFKKWINEYIEKIINMAVKNPLVSGFLKLLECGLGAAEYLKYFENRTFNENESLQIQLSYYFKSLLIKVQKVSGELQIACLELILKYPFQFYKEYILDLIPVFQMAFDLGKSMTWLAKIAVSALEKISEKFEESVNDLRKFYKEVLPKLDSYLQSKGIEDQLKSEIITYKNKKRIKKNTFNQRIEGTDLFEVQKRIFNFLGKLDPQNAVLVVSKDTISDDLVKWQVEQNVKISLNFSDMRAEIYLDTIIPRICHLAVTSSDRKTKIAACELVHALVLYMLGAKIHQGTIWKELCSKMLVLGADGDTTVQQMFEPLLRQIMHFMSKYENLDKGVDILMKILMDGISNSENCSIRDLSAICIREFVEWSIKQTTPQQLAASPVSIEMILEQLRMYSLDSNAACRVGSAIAFNNLYRKLREEESICDLFFIDLLYTFCVNFKLSEELSSVPINYLNSELEQVSLSLDHVIRVLKHRNYLFNKTNSRRKIPIEIGDRNNVTLKDVVLFLLKETESKLLRYRRKCFKMVLELSTAVENMSSLSQFLTKFTSVELLTKICEGSPNGNGIKARPHLGIIKDQQMSPHIFVYNWLQYFLSSLDCYSWLLGDNALQRPEIIFVDVNIFNAITYYFQKICWNTMFDLIQTLNPEFLNESSETIINMSIEEINRINSIKCVIVVQIMDFLTSILHAGCKNQIPETFWTLGNAENLINFINNIIYEPTALGFDFKSEEIARELPKRLESLLKNIQRHCANEDFIKKLNSKVISNLVERVKNLTDKAQEILNSEHVSDYHLNSTRGILAVMKNLKLFDASESAKNFLEFSGKKLILDLFEGIKQKIFDNDTTINPSPDVQRFGNQMMRISFIIGDVTDEFVRCLLNENLLKIHGTLTNIKHGEYFFRIYKRSIFEHFKKSFIEIILPVLFVQLNKTNLYYIVTILMDVTEYSYKYRQYDQQTLQSFVDENLNNLPKIFEVSSDQSEILLIVEYLSRLAMACPNEWSLSSYHQKAPVLRSWIIERIKDTKISLEHKSRILILLPLLVGPDDVENDSVTEALQDLQRQHFPLRSSEFTKNSLEETGLKAAFKSLLDSMISSRSFVILDFILKATAADKKHIIEYMIREDLKIFAQNLNSSQQSQSLEHIFEIITNEKWEPQIRITILNRFLIPVVQNSSVEAIISFYTSKFPKISTLIETQYGFAKSGWAVEHALVNRIIGFTLIEIFFGALPKERYYYTDCPLIQALIPNQNAPNVFVGTISKKSFYARKEVFVSDDKQAAEYFRIYQCSAYKALCAITCNTQTDIKFYLKFLFEEIPQKNEYIWQKIVDCSDDKIYILEGQEFETYPRVKERFVSIRKLNPNIDGRNSRSQGTSSRYLQTQNVFSSSLSQDVSKIDLNYSMVRSDAEAMARKELLSREILSVHLERSELNKHEIMPTICGVIKHMQENNITPLVPDPIASKKSYPWIVCIANAIDNFSNHKNIRIFLSQVVDNCRDVFEPYAHILFKPILQLLFDECAGSKLNFFTSDMIALLLSWSKKNLHKPITGDEIRLASAVLKFLMKNAWNDNKHIFKFNLELIQIMIGQWKNEIEIPHQLLLDMIQKTDRNDSKANECGIVLSGIVLANELLPWNERSKIYFIKKIFSNLNNDYTVVYQPAAHVLGMVLGTLNRINELEILDNFSMELMGKLKGLSSKRDNKKEKIFLDILYGAHKNYPEILDSFKETISYKIPSAIGAIKRIYLEMLLTRLEAYDTDEIFNIIVSIGIKDLLKSLEYQLLALHVLNKSLTKLNYNEIKNIFPIIESCVESSKTECRNVTYEILIYIVQNSNTEMQNDGSSSTSQAELNLTKEDIKKKSEILLLKGLLDVDSQIQKRIFEFWSQEANLSQHTGQRIYSLISNYSISCEQQFLGFCTQLILEPAIQNTYSKQQIFQFESDRDAKLQEYEINTNSRIRTSFSLPPLFADTQHNFLAGTNCNFVRETPNEYFFEPTKDPAQLSQAKSNFTLPTQSSLPFGIQPQLLDRRSQKLTSHERVQEDDIADQSMNVLRKRFLKDKEKEDREKALRVIDYRSRKASDSKLRRNEGKVILFRRYRFGDFPDLLINSLAFLLPLQGLVKRDRNIARQVFVSIFNSILENLGTESRQYIESIGCKIQSIFEISKTCDSIVFATFLEIALLKPQVFNIKPETISMISKASNMLTIGAIYLESRINADFDDSEADTSIKSYSTITNSDKHWLELSDIYNSLAEYDIVSAIFADKMDTDPRLAEAIELKANGRYSEAQQLLLKVIERRRLVEQNFSYNCFYECFVELGDWGVLSQAIQQQIDDFEELWTDEYNTNFYLPKLIQAELQLVLKGEGQSKDFLQILQNWMKDPIKADHIKQTFCEELMMLHIANSDYLQARVHCENHLKKFLIEWGVISSHYDKLRQESLLNTQKVAEIDYYALLLLERFDENVVDVLTHRWKNCKIDRSDSLRYWNCFLTYRTYISALFVGNLENFNDESIQTMRLQKSIHEMVLQLYNAAIYQKNYGVVDKLLKIDLLPLKDIVEDNLYLEYEIAQIKRILLQTDRCSASNSVEILEQGWIKSHAILNDTNLQNSVRQNIEILNLKSKIGEEVFKVIRTAPSLSNHIKHGFLKYSSSPNSQMNFHHKILQESYLSLKKSTEIADQQIANISDSNGENEKDLSEVYYRLAEFCYDYHQHLNIEILPELEGTMMRSVFQAMKYGSSDARQLFPCILLTPSLENEDLSKEFKEYSSDVPDWMFLTWIPQILSRFELKSKTYVDDIVYRLAKSYPNALKYPFNVWFDRVKSLDQSFARTSILRDEIQNIIKMLHNPMIDKFLIACKSLQIPQMVLNHLIEDFIKNMPTTSEEYIKKIDEIINTSFGLNVVFYGSLYRNILQYKSVFETLKQRNIHTELLTIRNELFNLHKTLTNLLQHPEKTILIENLCPWLAKFHWCGDEEFLELPGQYNVKKRPILEQHVKIVKFGNKVQVYSSLRKPIRLTIYGSDAKCYDFMIKFGEDLKQDQQIQQVFEVMSNKLKEDRQCRNHNLFIRTYNVIPIQQDGGMLSWVPNTLTMQDFIYNCLLRREPNGKSIYRDARREYADFISEPTKHIKQAKEVDIYGTAVVTYTRDQILANFRNIESKIHLEIIKYALVDMSVSPESFYVLRNNWMKTLAAMSIIHWILGIGDRHLQNILISEKDGSMTGVDFGIVLGGGIRNLLIPEMLPFRLTPHFVYAMNPMGTSGLFFKCMSHVLRVFRNSQKNLLACIEVFAREPTKDWLQLQKDSTTKWKPNDCIDVVKKKLLGYNPKHLLEHDLRESQIAKFKQEYADAYIQLLNGNPQFNIRARLAEKELTVEEQVKCLIDLATDPAILGSCYAGFHSWI